VESDEALNSAFARFKDLADKKREIFDEDIQALMSDEAVTPRRSTTPGLAHERIRKPGRSRTRAS
jgi:isopropylmalate/homocitrate/citramalate synthase